ncbi:MAG: hypothetical protein ACYDCO_22495 [Armatimonadota bacterium]
MAKLKFTEECTKDFRRVRPDCREPLLDLIGRWAARPYVAQNHADTIILPLPPGKAYQRKTEPIHGNLFYITFLFPWGSSGDIFRVTGISSQTGMLKAELQDSDDSVIYEIAPGEEWKF